MVEKYFKDQCFVLKSIAFQSTDAHLILFGKQRGKFMVLAKGIGKSNSKLAPLISSGNCIDIDYVRGKNGDTLISCSPIEGFRSRYSCYEALVTGMYICDLVDSSTERDETQEAIFYLLYFCMLAMNNRNYKEILVLFEWKYLALLGYGSDHSLYLRELLEKYWRTSCFSTRQQSIYDELSGFFSVFQSQQINVFSSRLSAAAYRVAWEVLTQVYQNDAQIYVKSQKILEQAIWH